MIIYKFILVAIAGIIDAMGGYRFLWARRYLMPFLIGVGISVATQMWWTGFLVLPALGTLCIGYSGGKWLIRGLWMALQAFAIGLGLFLAHFIAWYFYVPYILISGILGATLYNIDQVVGDFIFGSFLASIVFMVW